MERDSLEGITKFYVTGSCMPWESLPRYDPYLNSLIELNLQKFGIEVEGFKEESGERFARIYLTSVELEEYWEVTLKVEQTVLLINSFNLAGNRRPHRCTSYEKKAFLERKREGAKEVITKFLNDYLSVNEKHRDRQLLQPSPTPTSNELYRLPCIRRTTEPKKVIRVDGIDG